MTEQEANALVDDFSFVYNGKSISKEALIECRKVIHKALEKQIPKKPILDTIFPSGIKWWRCTGCNKILVGCIGGRPKKYCDDCGQALDWSND